jgi:hypothetical protein
VPDGRLARLAFFSQLHAATLGCRESDAAKRCGGAKITKSFPNFSRPASEIIGGVRSACNLYAQALGHHLTSWPNRCDADQRAHVRAAHDAVCPSSGSAIARRAPPAVAGPWLCVPSRCCEGGSSDSAPTPAHAAAERRGRFFFMRARHDLSRGRPQLGRARPGFHFVSASPGEKKKKGEKTGPA